MMQKKSEDDEDSFSLNGTENKSFDYPATDNLDNIPRLAMSTHSPSKHYPFSRRSTRQNLLDSDSDDDGQIITDKNPARFISNAEGSARYEQPISKPAASKINDKVGVARRQITERVKSPKPHSKPERISSLSDDSDESDDMGITKKKNTILPGEYNPAQYETLDVNDEIKEIFQFIIKYIPQQLNLDYKFKPFIPDFIPAVGDIDAFIKVVSPGSTLSGDLPHVNESQLGLTVLDEPAASQSDPALLHLQLKAASIGVSHPSQMMVVKKVDNVEKGSKVIDKWIKDVSELHKNKAATVVRYTNPMPEIDDLMQEWPEKFENALKQHNIPSAKFCGSFSQYLDILCALFDIPVYKNKIQSVHVLFCLYAAIKNSQSGGTLDGKDNSNMEDLDSKHNHLVLE